MGINKNILRISAVFIIIFISVLLVCIYNLNNSLQDKTNTSKTDKIEFPVDNEGYPKDSVILINGKEYNLKKEQTITINKENIKDNLVIILPEGSAIYRWFLKEDKDIDLMSYMRTGIPIKSTVKEGNSNIITKYEFNKPDTGIIEFKKSNINEKGKEYLSKEPISKLIIKVL